MPYGGQRVNTYISQVPYCKSVHFTSLCQSNSVPRIISFVFMYIYHYFDKLCKLASSFLLYTATKENLISLKINSQELFSKVKLPHQHSVRDDPMVPAANS